MEPRDWRQLPRTDLGVLATGILAFIVSFLPYYGATVKMAGFGEASESVNAWHGTALVGMLLVVAAAVVAAFVAFAPTSLPKIPVSWNFGVLTLSVVGAALVVIRSITLPSGHGVVDYGIRWGGWLLIVVCVAQAVFAALRFREKGEQLPWHHASTPPSAKVG